MDHRRLGRTGLAVSPVGFGSFKIGRNEGIKYARGYDLPDEPAVAALLDGVLGLGINLIDTAPAYGLSEERIGAALARRRDEIVLCTKAGETFEDGRSSFDFSPSAIRASVERSLRRLRAGVLDVLLIHSSGEDRAILEGSGAVDAVIALKESGLARAVGFSGKTVDGARAALAWADVLMVELHPLDRSHEPVIEEAARAGVGILVKKGLASGRLDPGEALPFLLDNPHVGSVVIGGLSLEHVRRNVGIVEGWEATSGRLPHPPPAPPAES